MDGKDWYYRFLMCDIFECHGIIYETKSLNKRQIFDEITACLCKIEGIILVTWVKYPVTR